jgi:hypothetical protein
MPTSLCDDFDLLKLFWVDSGSQGRFTSGWSKCKEHAQLHSYTPVQAHLHLQNQRHSRQA